MKNIDSKGLLFNLSFFSRSQRQLLILLIKQLKTKPKKCWLIFTPNAEQIVLSQEKLSFFNLLKQADILLPDGFSIVLTAKIKSFFQSLLSQGQTRQAMITERITGIDLVLDLINYAIENKIRILLLGGKGYDNLINQNKGKRSELINRLLDSKMFLWTEGYQYINQPTEAEEKSIESKVKTFRPQIMLVAFGAPEQEKWVVNHRSFLDQQNVKLVMVVGGAFDIFFAKLKRAPQWLQSLGLEWLFRLIQEPWRWQRQSKLLKYIFLAFREITQI